MLDDFYVVDHQVEDHRYVRAARLEGGVRTDSMRAGGHAGPLKRLAVPE